MLLYVVLPLKINVVDINFRNFWGIGVIFHFLFPTMEGILVVIYLTRLIPFPCTHVTPTKPSRANLNFLSMTQHRICGYNGASDPEK